MSTVADFLHVFRGNPGVLGMDDALGPDQPGPVRLEPDNQSSQIRAVGEAHLAGLAGMGVYPYHHPHGVAWGCVDFDDGELASWEQALVLRQGLHELGVTGWIERSRSKGYHVWVFAGGWVSMGWMRQLLMGACLAVGVPHREVNPKSSKLQPGQLGNFVRLPYKGVVEFSTVPHRDRQVVVDLNGVPLSLRLFLSEAIDHSLGTQEVVRIAKTLVVPRERPSANGAVRYIGPWQEQLSALARVQLEEGPKSGSQDRSGFLYAFAAECRRSGLDDDGVKKAVRLADKMHCHKYEARPDADERYQDIVDKSRELA